MYTTKQDVYTSAQVNSLKKTFDTATSKQLTTTENLTPIPLRTLTTLLNYERCISDRRFRGCKLIHSTFADPNLLDQIEPEFRQMLDSKPTSVKKIHLHVFRIDSDEITGTSSTNDIICPDAVPAVHALPFVQRELIYHESRGHDGCYNAIELYQQFFDLCPPGQALSIQLKNELPVQVSPFTRRILEFKMKGPKLLTISTGMRTRENKKGTIITGLEQESLHSVLGFAGPKSENVDFVVDMTRMQWGESGRGQYGELYYLGSLAGYYEVMGKVCDGIEELGKGATHVAPSEHTKAMESCARRVWKRWENRDKEGWCDYCGVGSLERRLLDCSACKKKKVRYCCKEHQKAAWKLHKLTCEKKTK
jgi:MYND finger